MRRANRPPRTGSLDFQMRALIFDGTRTHLATSHPDTEPAAGEAVIRTVRAGISRTDHAI